MGLRRAGTLPELHVHVNVKLQIMEVQTYQLELDSQRSDEVCPGRSSWDQDRAVQTGGEVERQLRPCEHDPTSHHEECSTCRLFPTW